VKTVLEWAAEWWSRVTAAPERQASVAPVRHHPPRVPPEYLSLYTYLDHRYASIVVLTFEQMEALLGFALPATASTERDWWTGAPSDRDRHSDAWMIARRTATPNLGAKTVTFERLP
jgi:hypothetical protein